MRLVFPPDTRHDSENSGPSEPRINRFTFQGQYAERALVNAPQRLTLHEPFQSFDSKRELAQRQ